MYRWELLTKTYISTILSKKIGEKVVVEGWVHRKRVHGKIAFVILRDRTGTIQVTFKKDILGTKFGEVKDLSEESVIKVIGKIKEKVGGGKEILVEDFKIINKAYPLPIEIWNPEIKTEFMKRVEYRFLDLRKPEILAIFSIRNKVIQFFREFLLKEGFIEMQTPKIVTMGVESGAEVFEVNYYGKKAYLPQSPQMYKQMLMASGIDKYFELGWYWRAEKSHTSRHLSEFYALDIEMAWIESHYDIIKFQKNLLDYVFKRVEKECSEELEILNISITKPKEYPVIPIWEAYEIIKGEGYNIEFGSDLNSESERILGNYFIQEYDEPLVFVINYPWEERPFYHMRLEEDPRWTKSYDLLFKGLEVTTGAQREHRYEILVKQAKEKGIPLEPLKHYLEAFKYGMPPHGGFGLGIDRFIKQLLNLKDVREAVLWFRDPEHVSP